MRTLLLSTLLVCCAKPRTIVPFDETPAMMNPDGPGSATGVTGSAAATGVTGMTGATNNTCTDIDGDTHCVPEDCDDANPRVWGKCSTCKDLDGDSHYVGCDAFPESEDADDSFGNVWNASKIGSCVDSDMDGLYAGGSLSDAACDRYADAVGGDCDDGADDIQNEIDVPGDGQDQDCDGEDAIIDEQHGLFVSATGNDSNPGTRALPMRTLQHAENVILNLPASANHNKRIFVGPGSYPYFYSTGRSAVIGGFNASWQFTPAPSGPARDAESAVIDGLRVGYQLLTYQIAVASTGSTAVEVEPARFLSLLRSSVRSTNTGSSATALHVSANARAVVSQSYLMGCATGAPTNAVGISVNGKLLLENSIVYAARLPQDSPAIPQGCTGIELDGADGSQLYQNKIFGGTCLERTALNVQNSLSVSVRLNTINTGCYADADGNASLGTSAVAVLSGSSSLRLDSNIIRAGDATAYNFGIVAGDGTLSVGGNVIEVGYAPDVHGLDVQPSSAGTTSVAFYNNTIGPMNSCGTSGIPDRATFTGVNHVVSPIGATLNTSLVNNLFVPMLVSGSGYMLAYKTGLLPGRIQSNMVVQQSVAMTACTHNATSSSNLPCSAINSGDPYVGNLEVAPTGSFFTGVDYHLNAAYSPPPHPAVGVGATLPTNLFLYPDIDGDTRSPLNIGADQ